MQFGICTSVENSAHIRSAGWDFIEENAQHILQPLIPDLEWRGIDRVRSALMPVPVIRHIAPADMKVVGSELSMPKLHAYTNILLKRASAVGARTVVFSSSRARKLTGNFDPAKATEQMIAALTMTGQIAAQCGVTVALEHIRSKESDVANSLKETLRIVTAVNHANIKCALNTYHFWQEDEPLEHLAKAVDQIVHVHLADRENRAAPGESTSSDYRPIFQILQAAGYKGAMSVDCENMPDSDIRAGRVLTFIKRQWQAAGGK